MHGHGRNGFVVLNSTLNVQRYVDRVVQPEVVPYVQGDDVQTSQYDNVFPFSFCLTQGFPRPNAVRTLPSPA